MDPIRRLILLGLVASVILAEPTQACALLSGRDLPADRQPVTATQRLIRQLAVVLRQTVKPAAVRTHRLTASLQSLPAPAHRDTTGFPLALMPHQSDLPPPLV